MSLAAFLLCAGYGQRLRPLTDRIAKPALTFLGKTALEINKDQVEKLGPQRWLVNAHHLPEQIASLSKQLGMEVLNEPEILGTGGCLYNAASILGQYDSFIVHNADLIHTIDLEDLLKRHYSSGALATLAGISHEHHNTLSCSAAGRLLGVHGYQDFTHGHEAIHLTFSGIAIYRREFLNYLGAGYEDIKRYWIGALAAGKMIEVVDCSQAHWYDFGTPQGLWEAAQFRMESMGEFSYRYSALPGEKPYVANEAGLDSLPAGLRNVLVYEKPVSTVAAGTHHCILGEDFNWPVQVERAL